MTTFSLWAFPERGCSPFTLRIADVRATPANLPRANASRPEGVTQSDAL